MHRISITNISKHIIRIFNIQNNKFDNIRIIRLAIYLHDKKFIIVNEFMDMVSKETINKLNYKELLLDSRWLSKSLKIKSRDGFKCKLCNSKDFLNVHHRTYTQELPWNEPDDNLITLCRKCHKKFHNIED